MEKAINEQIDQYLTQFKQTVRDNAMDLGLHENPQFQIIMQQIYDYERPVLSFKKKPMNAVLAEADQCTATLKDSEARCKRKCKKGFAFCSTHLKANEPNKVLLWTEEVKGILYYVDAAGQVYLTEDILNHVQPPRVIGRWTKTGEEVSVEMLGHELLYNL